MRVLHVVASMSPLSGGTGQGIRNSILAMNQMGITNEIACCDNPRSSWLNNDSFPIHALGEGKFGYSYNSNLTSWLKANINHFDTIILNGLWQYPTVATRQVAMRMKKPYYVMPHGMFDPWFQRDSSRRIKALRNWMYWKILENRTIRDAEALLFTCEEELRLARKTFRPYQPKQEINVGYGIEDPPAFTSSMQAAFAETCPGLKKHSYLLFLSRIHPKKGVELLIRAYSKLATSDLGKQTHFPDLVIAGPGLDTAYGKEIQELATIHNHPKAHIHFTGMLTGDAKWGAFYGCDAFVLPSHQENFGIAVVEALACGKPVLISNQVNIWREIEQANAGLVEADTQTGVFSLLEKWLQSKSNNDGQAAKSYACYKSTFSIEGSAKRLVEVLSHFV